MNRIIVLVGKASLISLMVGSGFALLLVFGGHIGDKADSFSELSHSAIEVVLFIAFPLFIMLLFYFRKVQGFHVPGDGASPDTVEFNGSDSSNGGGGE